MQRPVHTAKVIPLTGTSRAAKQSSLPRESQRASKTAKKIGAFAYSADFAKDSPAKKAPTNKKAASAKKVSKGKQSNHAPSSTAGKQTAKAGGKRSPSKSVASTRGAYQPLCSKPATARSLAVLRARA